MIAGAQPPVEQQIEPDMDAVCEFLATVRTDDASNLLDIAYLCLRDIREFRNRVQRKLTQAEMQGIADVIALAWAALDIAQEMPLSEYSSRRQAAAAN